MEKFNPTKLALAFGLPSVIIYLGCILTMWILGKVALVKLANLLFHGIDFSNIIRAEIPIGES